MIKYLIILIALLPHIVSAQTTYYVSWAVGNDANDGLTINTPFKSLRKAELLALNPGDKVLFKRGDEWHFDNEVSFFDGFDVLNSGTAGNYITYGAYGTGSRPRFIDRQTIPGWQTSSNWISRGGNRWAIYISGLTPLGVDSRCRVWADSVELACPDPKSATPTAVTSTKRFAIATDSLYIYSTTNPATAFTTMQKSNSNKRQGIKIGGVDYIKISNIDVSTSATSSFVVYNSDNIIIDSCNAGWDGVYSPIIVYSSNTGVISNTMINSGYKIDNQFQFDGPEDGISLEQGTTNWDVYQDTMINMIHSGFGFDYSTSDIITNNSVHDCFITAPDVAYGRGFTFNTNAGSYGNKIYNNKIINTPTCNQISGPGLDMYNNLIDSVTKPDYRTDRAGAALAIISYNETEIRNVNIFNNTIANCENMAFDIEGRLDDSIVDNNISNNILYNNGLGGQETHPYQIYLLDDNPIVKRLTFKNNIIYKPGETILIYYSPNDVNSNWPKTVAQFNSTDGDYENTIQGNLNVDPLFVSTTDFNLQSGSPAIGAGVDVGLPYSGSAPDIGAYAYTATALPPTVTTSGNQTISTSTASVTSTATAASGQSITSYVWTKISGSGSITSPTSQNTGLTGLSGTSVFRVTVTQTDGQTAYAELTITVTTIAPPTVTTSGNQTLITNSTTVFSTPVAASGQTISSVLWTDITGSGSATITSPTSQNTGITGLSVGTHIFRVTVTQSDGQTAHADVSITLTAPPTANAGTDQTITLPTSSVTLSGSGTVASGQTATYEWTKVSGAGTQTITGNTTLTPTITGMTTAGDYVYQLKVIQTDTQFALSTVKVHVNAAPTPTQRPFINLRKPTIVIQIH